MKTTGQEKRGMVENQRVRGDIGAEGSHVGVIGGGLGGLAAAVTLASRGHRVTLLEKNGWLGGKAAVLEEEGFRFDMGPTILTVPSVLRRIFGEAGKDLERELDLVRLNPQWRCFFEGGSVLDLDEGVETMERNLAAFSGEPGVGEGYRDFMELSAHLHDISRRYYFWKPIGGITDMMDKGGLRISTLKDVLALRMGRSVAGVIRGKVPDARAAQMMDHFTQYVGSSPYGSPAVLCGIAHMQTQDGLWYPRGGTRAVPRALQRLVAELGVEVRLDTEVRGILSAEGAVTGVELGSGECLRLTAVVSNMDSIRSYGELGDERLARRFAREASRHEPACSGVVLYLGLKERYDHLLHHNFVFSENPKEEFEWIYERGEPAPDPTCYVAAPARTDASVAPAGGEALYVLVHTPYLRAHHRWEEMLPAYGEKIMEKLERCAGMGDLRQRVVYSAVLTPQDIHERYRVSKGAIYGLASHGRFLGAFKPGNRSPHLKGLYLGGGSAHPGPGMPMALMSGWIAADALHRDALAGMIGSG